MRMLFVGLDGLGVDMFERVTLPTLDQAPMWGTCRAPVAMTGPSWTSIFTGKPIEQHGVTSIFGNAVDGSRTFADLEGAYIFEALPNSGAFLVPTTFPPRAGAGSWMVSGYPFKPKTAPASLSNGLEIVGDYATFGVKTRARSGLDTFWPKAFSWNEALFALQVVQRLHVMALVGLPAVDYLFAVSTYFDRIGHLLGGCPDAPEDIEGAFTDAAEYVTALLKTFVRVRGSDADLIVAASDHGFAMDAGGHTEGGFWAMWGHGVKPGRMDITNHDLRGIVESALQKSEDAAIIDRLVALGYVEGS